jgi:hypothetical protein
MHRPCDRIRLNLSTQLLHVLIENLSLNTIFCTGSRAEGPGLVSATVG